MLSLFKTKFMRSNKLRIGNWVNGNYNGFSKNVKVYDFDRNNIQHSDETQTTIPIDNFKPIQLTEEWLIKFGINKYSDNHYILEILQRSRLHFYTEKDSVSVELGNKSGYSFGYPKIKYVHELQNLVFALTGKELEFSFSEA